MHKSSDGKRIRVHILIGLICTFKVVLLDEITTSFLIPSNNNHAKEEQRYVVLRRRLCNILSDYTPRVGDTTKSAYYSIQSARYNITVVHV